MRRFNQKGKYPILEWVSPPPRPFDSHDDFVEWARVESENGSPDANNWYLQMIDTGEEFGGWIQRPGTNKWSPYLCPKGRGMYGNGKWSFYDNPAAEEINKAQKAAKKAGMKKTKPIPAALLQVMARQDNLMRAGLLPSRFNRLAQLVQPGQIGRPGAGGPSRNRAGNMGGNFGGPQQATPFNGGLGSQFQPGFGQPSAGPSRATGGSRRSSMNDPRVSGLGRDHTEVNGMQTDDPRFFRQNNRNAGPPNSRPIPRTQGSGSMRGGGGPSRASGGHRKKRSGGGGFGKNDDPLAGWQQASQNWAAPKNDGPKSVPEATVYDDGSAPPPPPPPPPPPLPPQRKAQKQKRRPPSPPPLPKKDQRRGRSPNPPRQRSPPLQKPPTPAQAQTSGAPTLTPELLKAHPKGDTRFPPPHISSSTPRKLTTDDGRRLFYTLLYQNACADAKEMEKSLVDEAKKNRKLMSKDENPKMKCIQAFQSKKLELVSTGPRGKIWRVDDTAMDVVGCLLDMESVQLGAGIRERFELFGIGMKEIYEDILLISWPVKPPQ
ncbi:hypothetical protein P280DRAFT_552021 [Massarina eburnea CBS 473.64]|uniref:Uncharacterized protein n=1 Tax=Massarina eburnea CBS 473.64 TaxID=1395130 RepID=A0A6A6RUF2_9PLEO|nr:hypothetical protein P280DRAFT_552021 [Massarina eburnea CBS 473.64]